MSDEEASQIGSIELAFEDRRMLPLPKRARYNPRPAAREEPVPALDADPSSRSSTTEETTPSTPPALQYYQPLFASVGELVKQVASATTLFGSAGLDVESASSAEYTQHSSDRALTAHDSTSDYESYEEHEPASPRQSLGKDTLPSRNRASHPQGYPQDEADVQSGSNRKKRKIPASEYLSASPHAHASDCDFPEADEADDPRSAAADLGLPLAEKSKAETDWKGSKRSRSSKPVASPSGSPRRTRRVPPTAVDSTWGAEQPPVAKTDSTAPPARKTLKSKKAATEPPLPLGEKAHNAPPPVRPKIMLDNLYKPDAGPLYLGSGVVPKKPPKSHFLPPHDAALPTVAFSFHVELSNVLMTRLEDMNRERERLQLARELVRERARELELTKKRDELEEAVRKNEAALAELKPTASVGIQADGDLSGGRVLEASRWSTKEASQPLQRPLRKAAVPPVAAPAPAAGDKKAPPRKGKKKRSAYANANNAHHRDNYVPSRQPRVGGAPSPALDPDFPSLGLVAADNPFSTSGHHPQLGFTNLVPFFAGAEEWLCAWCESDLLFGDSAAFAKCLKKRANVLKIRKRAQKRAARAASGQALTKEQQKQKAKQKAANTAKQAQAGAAPSNLKNATTQTVPFEEMHKVAPAAPVAPAAEPEGDEADADGSEGEGSEFEGSEEEGSIEEAERA